MYTYKYIHTHYITISLKVRLHDTTGCQTVYRFDNGLYRVNGV